MVEDVKITNERLKEIDGLDSSEAFAYWHADQWIGCVQCKRSHHVTSFCKCKSCFFTAKIREQSDHGTFLMCRKCRSINLWD